MEILLVFRLFDEWFCCFLNGTITRSILTLDKIQMSDNQFGGQEYRFLMQGIMAKNEWQKLWELQHQF